MAGDREALGEGPDPRDGLPTITDAVLDQWQNSAEYDMENGTPWATNPAAVLSVIYELRDLRAALAAAREPVAPAEAEPPGLRAAAQMALDSGDTFRGRQELHAALAQPPAPVSAETTDVAWDDLEWEIDGAVVRGGWPNSDGSTEAVIARHRPAIEAAIRGTTPLDAALDRPRLRQAFLNAGLMWVIPVKSFEESVEVVANEYDNLGSLATALRGQPSETPAAGDGEAGE